MRGSRVIIVGHSHIAALKKAAEDRPTDSACVFKFLNLNAIYDSNAMGKAIREFAPEVIASCIGGNAHTIFGLVEHPAPFDFIDPDDESLPTDRSRQLIPYGAMNQLLKAQMKEHLEQLEALRGEWPQPFVHLESPPVNPSEAHIRENPGAFREMIAERGVAPRFIRHKLWRLHSAIYRRACEKLKVHYVPAPLEAQDENGMLAERAWNPDPTHANAWYGARVLGQLERLNPETLK